MANTKIEENVASRNTPKPLRVLAQYKIKATTRNKRKKIFKTGLRYNSTAQWLP